MSSEEAPPPGAGNAKKKPDVRVYLEEKVFPILTRVREELLRAVEDREKKAKESEEEEIPDIQPLLFLARYLMRNAPQESGKVSSRSARGSRESARATKTDDDIALETNQTDSTPEADL
jgi:hypothetical protein